jgi:uncharacterized protein YprB with RNaseH-like and TPR domain
MWLVPIPHIVSRSCKVVLSTFETECEGGQSAQLMYRDWLKSGDDSIIQRVEQYNREDVLAMVAVDHVLRDFKLANAVCVIH